MGPVECLLDHQVWKGLEADVLVRRFGEHGGFEHGADPARDDRDGTTENQQSAGYDRYSVVNTVVSVRATR